MYDMQRRFSIKYSGYVTLQERSHDETGCIDSIFSADEK